MLMLKFSGNHLPNLQNEFNSLGSYYDKLIYFDKTFSVVPIRFPVFTPELLVLFDRDKMQELIKIRAKEHNRRTMFQRKFVFKNDEYVFSICPPECGTEVYNNYVIAQFLKGTEHPEALIRTRITSPEMPKKDHVLLLEEAHSLINTIEHSIQRPGKTTYQNAFFKDFYTGFAVAGNTHLLDLHAVKKLLELYLYAQGILFYRYIVRLKSLVSSTGDTSICNCESELRCEQIRIKIELLKKTGIINFLKEKFTSASSTDVKKDVAETLCSLIDELNSEKNYLLSQI